MSAPLIIAVPSKGRLQENAFAFFARAGLPLVRPGGERDYRGTIKGVPDVEVAFLSASDIVGQLATGAAHLGITGEDLLREQLADADAVVEFVTPLGFGFADVVVAAPKAWIDVRTMADLDDVAADIRQRHGRRLRVATKYINLTRRFFAYHGVGDYRIVESLGATEGAPAAGTAEIIVDITTTGATLAANALKIVDDGVILRSQANLVASVSAPWSGVARRAARTILTRIAAEEEARNTRELTAVLPEGVLLPGDLTERFYATLPLGLPDTQGHVTLHCPGAQVFALADFLVHAGADPVTVRSVDWVLRRTNPLIERLLARIGAGIA
ncbi:ATP phosphoribosyltransferase [Pseudochelatococcus lubricantis]|uniref:ATP phosphoribosyltransferase n=1 Tax=Pseudochelatococcus lubricantis TaxID=1538102 RepID=UPI0035E5C941